MNFLSHIPNVNTVNNLILGMCLFFLTIYSSLAAMPMGHAEDLDQYNEETTPLVEFIIDPKNEASQTASNEIKKTLSYAKIPFKTITQRGDSPIQLAKNTKVLVVLNIDFLTENSLNKVIKFIAKGGTLIALNNGETKKFGFLAGTLPLTSYSYNTTAQGYQFNKNLFLNKRGHTYDDFQLQFGLGGENFPKSVNVWATAENDSTYPAIIKRSLGKGQVIVFNTGKNNNKAHRGLFFSAIMSGLPEVPWPVVGSGTIFLNHFISPLFDFKKEPVTTEFDLSQAEFYTKVWWPDMRNLANELKLTYTIPISFDYRNKTKPPFTFQEWDNSPTILVNNKYVNSTEWLLSSAQRSNHEVAFKGYNSLPLTLNNWGKSQNIKLSLDAVKKKWKTQYTNYQPHTYVPPSNQMDQEGFKALTQSFTNLKVVSSSYLGNPEDGAGREFDPEPWNPDIFGLPQITRGFNLNNESVFNAHSLILYTGIWTHALQPEDIYSTKEKQSSSTPSITKFWKKSKGNQVGLYYDFLNDLLKIQSNFPFMEFLSAHESAKKTKNWRTAHYKHSLKNNQLWVKKEGAAQDEKNLWFVYIPDSTAQKTKQYLSNKGFSYHSIPWMDGFLFQIQTKNPEISLPYAGKQFSESTDKKYVDVSLKEYKDFKKGKIQFEDIDEEIDFSLKKGEIEHVITLLKKKIQEKRSLALKDWIELYKYLSWENRSEEFWSLLDQQHRVYPSTFYTRLSKIISDRYGFPDTDLQQYWMQEQMNLDPQNKEVREKYFEYFGGLENLTAEEAKEMLEGNLNDGLKTTLLVKILDEDPEGSKFILASYAPCSVSFTLPLAQRIAYYYANMGDYKKAIAWSDCASEIPKLDLQHWHLVTGDIEVLKTDQFPLYIEYLVQHEPEKAIEELQDKKAYSIEGTYNLNGSIAYTFANNNKLQEALNWAEYAPDFPLGTKLQWLYDLQDYKEMDRLYATYNQTHPQDSKIDLAMAEFLFYRGELIRTWDLLNKLPEGSEKQALLDKLIEVQPYQDLKTKKLIFEKYAHLMPPTIQKKAEREIIYDTHDAVGMSSHIWADRLDPTSLQTSLFYDLKDEKFNTHSFSFHHYKGFELSLNPNPPSNRSLDLVGLGYGFQKAKSDDKVNYGAGFKLESQHLDQYFFQLHANINYSSKKMYHSFSVTYQPVENAPGHHLGIYQAQLRGYEELKINRKLSSVLFLEGNLYDDGGRTGQVSLQFSYKWQTGDYSAFKPFIEGSGMLGNKDYGSGYPYWAIEKRLYGGGGLAYVVDAPINRQLINLDMAFFKDSYSRFFQRYRAQIRQPLGRHFELKGGMEFYTVKNFYHNAANISLKYHF